MKAHIEANGNVVLISESDLEQCAMRLLMKDVPKYPISGPVPAITTEMVNHMANFCVIIKPEVWKTRGP